MITHEIDKILTNISSKLSENYSAKIASLIFPIPRITSKSLIEYCKKTNTDFFYWKKPSEEFTFLAIGKLLDFSNNDSSLKKVESEIENLMNNVQTNWEEFSISNIPLFVGGVKFHNSDKTEIWQDYQFQNWILPKYAFIRNENDYFLQINFENENMHTNSIISEISALLNQSSTNEDEQIQQNGKVKSELNDFEEWENQIKDSLKLISERKLNKIVISRYEVKEIDENPPIYSMFNKLSSSFPFCTIFGFQKNNSFFFGATPETLFKITGNQLETDSLAGSIWRGKNVYEDDILANKLLTSDKNIREHNEVKDYILSVMQNYAKMIIAGDSPKIRKLKNIQHLWTPIKVTLAEKAKILTILHEIHPTPAVCGSPKQIAYENIPQIEKFNRGMFTGVVGWFNHLQVADFSVAIRSALVKNNKLYAYAGCGIVEGSVAKEEYDETKLKLKTILSLFCYDED